MVTNKPDIDIEESVTHCRATFVLKRLFSVDFVAVILVVVAQMSYHVIFSFVAFLFAA